MILFHHKSKKLKPQFAPWVFLALILIFATMIQYQVIVGLTGLGVTLVIAGFILELNSPKVWADSKQWRNKNKLPWYRKPTETLYQAHIWLLWPAVILLGIYALYAAFTLA